MDVVRRCPIHQNRFSAPLAVNNPATRAHLHPPAQMFGSRVVDRDDPDHAETGRQEEVESMRLKRTTRITAAARCCAAAAAATCILAAVPAVMLRGAAPSLAGRGCRHPICERRRA
eukprot:1240640-Pleurochrysis_carterae.AAC.1